MTLLWGWDFSTIISYSCGFSGSHHGDHKSPSPGVVGPLLTTYKSWDDPPSSFFFEMMRWVYEQVENPTLDVCLRQTGNPWKQKVGTGKYRNPGETFAIFKNLWVLCVSIMLVFGGVKYFFHPKKRYVHHYLGKWSNLTSIFFRWVGSTTNLLNKTLGCPRKLGSLLINGYGGILGV